MTSRCLTRGSKWGRRRSLPAVSPSAETPLSSLMWNSTTLLLRGILSLMWRRGLKTGSAGEIKAKQKQINGICFIVRKQSVFFFFFFFFFFLKKKKKKKKK